MYLAAALLTPRSTVPFRFSRTKQKCRSSRRSVDTLRLEIQFSNFHREVGEHVQQLCQVVTPFAVCCALTWIAIPPALAELPLPHSASLCGPYEERRAFPPFAAVFGGAFDGGEEGTDPFTLYGKTLKKYLIENVVEGRIVSRGKGFTVNTCIGTQPEVLETPQFRGLSSTEKEEFSETRICVEATGTDLEETCGRACRESCQESLTSYSKRVQSEQGIRIGERLQGTLLRRCIRQCTYECRKPGKISDFYIPSRT